MFLLETKATPVLKLFERMPNLRRLKNTHFLFWKMLALAEN